MMRRFVLLNLLVGYALSGLAQTNPPALATPILKLGNGEASVSPSLGRPPRLSLRADTEPLETPVLLQTTNRLPSETFKAANEASASDLPFEQRIYERLRQAGYFDVQPKSDNPIQRSIDAIWEPEVFTFGKTKVSCSIATAIHRKNPLCVLSPLFFQLSF